MSEKFFGHGQGGTNVGKQGEKLLCYLGKKVQPPQHQYTSNIYEIVSSQKIIKQKENFKGGRPP